MERLMKPFRLRSSKDRKPLSEEQKRKRAGFVVYPLMFLLCLGSFYLIFSPSGQERERQDKGQGFNTEIPSPEDSRLEGNKKDAYEKALMEQESRKRKTFFEAAESMFAKEERKDSVRLPDNIIPERQTNTETETEKGTEGAESTGNTEETEPEPEVKEAPNPMISYVLIGSLALIVIGAAYYFKVVRKKKEDFIEDEDEDEEDNEEYENEDEESEEDTEEDFFDEQEE